ncbi:hypothetical protein BV898_18533 [Hypsibius exemplaris]|uniref:BHLH domain-containing protein n=1 Tax=Hypsibius exemplaris TaxID=2072580 RepID=A0A9X6NPB9_HYPEX|nr:hypothetical protein BV898_18533 [Hypsibius exemplaris]
MNSNCLHPCSRTHPYFHPGLGDARQRPVVLEPRKHLPMKLRVQHTKGASPAANIPKRTHSINAAFVDLRSLIPTEPRDRKLSKIETLQLAAGYILHLWISLNCGGDGGDGQSDQSPEEATKGEILQHRFQAAVPVGMLVEAETRLQNNEGRSTGKRNGAKKQTWEIA